MTPTKTTVRKINSSSPHYGYDYYIGRRMVVKHGNGHKPTILEASPFANTFKVGIHGTRSECLRLYRNKLMQSPTLLALIPTLRGKRLGCWCHETDTPDPLNPYCHGDILAALADNPPSGDFLPPIDRLLDPTTQECFGYYGYGSGVYGMEETKKALLNSAVPNGAPVPTFCGTCPKKEECWTAHQRLQGEAFPDAVKEYFEEVAQYAAANPTTAKQAFGIVATSRLEANNPEPWMAGMLRNFSHAQRVRATLQPPTEGKPA